jgi:hypothetical protein
MVYFSGIDIFSKCINYYPFEAKARLGLTNSACTSERTHFTITAINLLMLFKKITLRIIQNPQIQNGPLLIGKVDGTYSYLLALKV